ncbi:MAG: hypothetical protein A2504_15060 [Bdellovibrionales bacterium RIFOXYD12_FULL_39_22]|nr:MAG: hypothetical protein A2385_02490 [Bdellovibrionales bacterium RIFOXYB1_FULL_39_21]OFZ43115.1 MAG: hypothetical protein A2485_11635 [Bdellovibrionales bacterium RIFOXYC12_FULL_39_17]OFZ47853.1 MAG: hypothetical protein A2404_16275 [Bdellovibrionales bacterium RIFOXYC1_FULL_39_130]OFZ75633.1 MAG: hypothetical protein A2560_12775 [Bdellovibrionales bacterium RIFOXYD1_FULL_39_84]OFZ94123.1 MAG: hypothetical protein A2504_15060 [Bdellovibrionales bacterium RIFOXYD12_FULL_39_22]HLE11812.1 hy
MFISKTARTFSFILGLVLTNSFALTDYSDVSTSSSGGGMMGGNAPRIISAPRSTQNISNVSQGSVERGSKLALGFSLAGKYEALSLDRRLGDGPVSIYTLEGHLDTAANLFLDLSYSAIASGTTHIAPEGATLQPANAKVMVGLNWLKLGSASDMATFNILGGANFAPSESDFTSSRLDKVVGLQTGKRFYSFILDLGYELTLTEDADQLGEVDVGNIQKFYGKLGWIVSSDIAFQLEATTISISSSDNFTRNALYRLTSDVDFGYLSPKLNLGLGRLVELELGALFRLKRAAQIGKLLDAHLWDTHGVYGDGIYSALIVSI